MHTHVVLPHKAGQHLCAYVYMNVLFSVAIGKGRMRFSWGECVGLAAVFPPACWVPRRDNYRNSAQVDTTTQRTRCPPPPLAYCWLHPEEWGVPGRAWAPDTPPGKKQISWRIKYGTVLPSNCVRTTFITGNMNTLTLEGCSVWIFFFQYLSFYPSFSFSLFMSPFPFIFINLF